MKTVVLTGASGGKMASLADVSICVPSQDVQRIQEVHLSIEHVLCSLVEQELFGGVE